MNAKGCTKIISVMMYNEVRRSYKTNSGDCIRDIKIRINVTNKLKSTTSGKIKTFTIH